MTDEEGRNVSTARAYLTALQAGESGDAIRRFFTNDARQTELPNQLNPRGQESDLEDIVTRSVLGTKVLKHQRYEIISEVAQASCVAIEARWTGVLAAAVGKMTPGTEMKASFAIFLQFRDGLIFRQHNYDCFDPWE